jgi:PLD-like domain
MADFDLTWLLNYTLPRFLCPKCSAIFASVDEWVGVEARCPVCNLLVQVFPKRGGTGIKGSLEDWVKETEIVFEDPISHGKALARIASFLQSNDRFYTPLNGFLAALSAAENFVHFTTYNLNALMLGVFALAGHRVSVTGVVGKSDSWLLAEIERLKMESPQLDIVAYPDGTDWTEMPHQKLVVIDGLLAFKGSANLTTSGWRKAAEGLDSVEAVTDLAQVRDLNNRLFSPLWARVGTLKDEDDLRKLFPDSLLPRIPEERPY